MCTDVVGFKLVGVSGVVIMDGDAADDGLAPQIRQWRASVGEEERRRRRIYGRAPLMSLMRNTNLRTTINATNTYNDTLLARGGLTTLLLPQPPLQRARLSTSRAASSATGCCTLPEPCWAADGGALAFSRIRAVPSAGRSVTSATGVGNFPSTSSN